jgi:hypothetical protein
VGGAVALDGDRELGEVAVADHLSELLLSGGASVWWTWTATRTRSLLIDTCGSAFDAGLAVYTGASVDALTQLDQQAFGNCPGAPGRLIYYVVTAGVTYHIAVDGYNGATGAITLHLRPPLANDDFANAIVLSGVMATAIGTNDGASSEPGRTPFFGPPDVRVGWV